MTEEYATQREFDDFRQETRDQYKFVIRLLLTTMGTAVLAGLLPSVIALVGKS